MNGWSYRQAADWVVIIEGRLTANTDTPRLNDSYVLGSPAEVEFCASGDWMYVLPDICVNTKGSSWSTSTHTETGSASAWPPLRLCYRLAVVFRYFNLVLKNCVNLKLPQSSSVFTCISSRMSCHLFWRRYFRLKLVTATWQRSSVPSTCWIGALEVVELAMEVRIFVHTVHQTIHPLIYSRKGREGLVYQEALQKRDEF